MPTLSELIDKAVVVDFETLPITNRPCYPPVPVGVALCEPGREPEYLAWGHPLGVNNTTWEQARKRLRDVCVTSGRPLLFHNAKFDVDVAETHMDFPRLDATRYHDTLPMLFLLDPHAATYALKPSAERLLQEPPTERDAVVTWLVEHQPLDGIKLSDKPKSKTYAGAYVAWAPVALVGPYACGDVTRTKQLALLAAVELEHRQMVEAYEREQRLLLPLMTMERDGVRLDVKRLTRDVELYQQSLTLLDEWIWRKLKAPNVNLDSGAELARALLAGGLASENDLGFTATGKVQTNKAALRDGVKDPQLLATLTYRAQLCTCLRTFMVPWLATATVSGGRIFTTWHSTRTSHHESGVGTRTGRLSSTPNFQNMAKTFPAIFASAETPALPKAPIDLLPLPLVRSYVVPYERGDVLCDRDYSQQELRILGHFEDDVLKRAYLENPRLDVHALAQQLINGLLGTNFERKPIKNTGFGLIYGMGLGLLAEKINADVATAKRVRDAYLSIFPGLKAIYADMKQRASARQPIRTWGGREYYCEEPKLVDGRVRHFDYKLLNVLIQGSAADCTKEAVCRYAEMKPSHHRILLTAHDELLVSAPRDERHEAMKQLREAMESVEFDVRMLSDGSWSPTNWTTLKPYDDKRSV